ncbi:MAG: hypothetical protein SA339_09380 [Methanomassiliicoccus sp.]|nr:hypothetical protein [Methanomassiliicoccus sp.]
MRAQIAMEQAERSGASQTSPRYGQQGQIRPEDTQDVERRVVPGLNPQLERGSGVGREQPSDWVERQTDFPAGTGSRYRDPNAEPRGPASTGESFTSGPSMQGPPSEQRYMSREDMRRTGSDAVGYPAGRGSYYPESPESPVERASTGESFTSGPDVARGAGESRKPSTTDYPAGTGSVYRDPRYQDTERASTGEYFTAGPDVGSREGGAERRRSATDYPAGTGSVYRDPRYQDTERASTGEYFTSGPEATGRAPSGAPSGYYPSAPSGQAPREQGMTAAAVSKAKGMTQTVTEKAKSVDTGKVASTMGAKGRDVSHMVSGKAKELEESRGAEDFANRAGEVIGRAIRKTASVTKELTSGFKKGMSSEHKEKPPEYSETTTTETRRVIRQEEEK